MPLRSISFIIALLLLSACEQQGQPILRGVKIDKAGQDSATQSRRKVDVSAAGETQATQPDTGSDDDSGIELNLTLPDYDWDTPPPGGMKDFNTLPDVFSAPGDESVLKWSGRVYLDESEEARERPMLDTIQGAEVEIQLKTN
ncbi:MAG: hypothetical protein CMI02_19680 [Oceanospirillaceae bacterium]|nr:hypothetical protein [Oceanospirillaceae bacterium]MBT14250.1 hypothetical protein [Oceanospirillaceae bacterium]|tara:strand:+ start:7734 stop:8162 length:429 start_codon:yes stop_codon:yes gene_type:complete